MERPERGMGDAAESAAATAREQAEEMGAEARSRGKVAKEKVASGLDQAASRLRHNVESMPPGTARRQAMEKVASGVQSTAEYLRGVELRTLGDDTRKYIRENPANALLIAASAGFILGLLVSRR